MIIILSFYIIYSDEQKIILRGNDISDTIFIEYVIIDNTLLLKSGHRILKSEQDYIFDKGRIILNSRYDSLEIQYSIFEPKLKYTYQKFVLKRETFIDSNSFNINKQNTDIFLSGYKGFIVDINDYGNTNFNQTLNINIQGKVSDNWFIKGMIYDNTYQSSVLNNYNVPLNQLDNINIMIYDSTTLFSFGNSSFETFKGIFNNRDREILGIYFRKLYNGYLYSGAVAGQKGVFKSIEFYCQDGVQGPYKLIGNIMLADYMITPGTDIIYLNGELLKKGEDEDYIIDYQKGEITFTVNRIVDENSFIYAEFQTIENNNPLTGYYFAIGGDSTKYKILFIREVQSVIDENTIELIKNIDNDTSSIFIPSVEYVGIGNGSYILRDSFYQYVDSNAGDYKIEFFYTGYNQGDYIYNPIDNSFVYVGFNKGNYMPGQYIDLPFESDYIALQFQQNIFNGFIAIEGGGGFYDYNTYNKQNDYIKDASYSIKYNTGNISMSDFRSNIEIAHIYFSPFYRNKWDKANENLKDIYRTGILTGFGTINRFTLNSNYRNRFNMKFNYSIKDSIIGRQINIGLPFYIFDLNYTRDYKTINNRISYIADFLNLTKGIGKLLSAYNFKKEKRTNSILYENNIKFELLNNNIVLINTKELNNNEQLNREFYAVKNRFNFLVLSNNVFLNSEYRKTFSNNKTINKLYMTLNISKYNKNNLDYYFNFDITSLSTYKETEEYIYVGKGKGDYVFDSLSNDYYYDQFEGEYIKIIENIQSEVPLAARKFIYNLNYTQYDILLSMNGNYYDNAERIYVYKTDLIESYNIYNNIYMDYKINKSIIPFYENNYSSSNKTINYFYKNIENQLGIFSINNKFNYKIFMFLDLNYIERTNSNFEDFTINGINMNINIENMPFNYDFLFVYNTIKGVYFDNYTDTIFPLLKFSNIQLEIKYYFNDAFYISILPLIGMGIYYGDFDIPLSLHYRFPEGMSYKGNIKLNWSNNFLNLNIDYISEFNERDSFRQKLNIAFYTYF